MMSGFVFCQSGSINKFKYPKIFVYEGDSIVAITLQHLDTIQKTRFDYLKYKELSGVLAFRNTRDSLTIKSLNRTIFEQDKALVFSDSLHRTSRALVFIKDERIEAQERSIKRAANLNYILGGGLVVSILTILITII